MTHATPGCSLSAPSTSVFRSGDGYETVSESQLKEEFEISFLCTNVRKTNKNKGRLGIAMFFAFFRFVSLLTWKLLSHRPAVVYYPITATQVGWIGRDVWCIHLSRLFGARVVIHLRASHFRLNYEQFKPWAKRWVQAACKRVHTVVVQANYLFDQFDGLIDHDRMVCLYQAIEATEYDNPKLEAYQRNRVLMMGHLTQAKGYCDLLNAIPRVAERIPDVQFYCAGTLRKGERNVLFNQLTGERLTYEDPFECEQALLAGEYAGNYTNLGVVHDGEKLEHLRSCDIFALPSYSEGFSRAVVEAMCVGKPLVCTPVGAHREVFEDGREGKIVLPGDVGQLANAICELLENREQRDKMAAYNYQSSRERFDISVIAGQFSEILKNALT